MKQEFEELIEIIKTHHSKYNNSLLYMELTGEPEVEFELRIKFLYDTFAFKIFYAHEFIYDPENKLACMSEMCISNLIIVLGTRVTQNLKIKKQILEYLIKDMILH